jgi:pullulanase/glycogen debranching enzyme
MFRKLHLLLWFVAICQLSLAQVITTNPAIPVDTKAVTITFDSSKDSRLGYYTSDLYAHTGVYTSGTSGWQHVIGDWGDNTKQPKLTNKGNGIYELTISPSIIAFYSATSGELITKMNFVFRSADGKKQTNDMSVSVTTTDMYVSITSPSRVNVFDKNQAFRLVASANTTADLKLFQDKQEIAGQTATTTIAQSISISTAGNYWFKVTATQNAVVKKDSVYVCIKEATVSEPLPTGIQAGINYTDNQSATLAIYAPKKSHIFVIGDFNNWLPDNNFQLKKDGDYFWLKLNNLTAQKEYIFQYLIDGSLKIADPYSEKISDSEDGGIPATTYPNLIAYPTGKATDRASVLQTGQTAYSWTTTTYSTPQASKLSIYELLIRDFTTEKTYKAVQAKLSYLKKLGVNTIELMPFSEFEGNSSWGYNPNFYFAPDKAYGTKNDLKALIDECHRQGFIVIQDIVLNHAYGSCPLVKMYWNETLGRPSADNPWFNETSPNTAYSWGFDFNHESQATKDFVDRVTKYWLTEYKVDGFRFDFTKGFTNTPGDGSGYDAPRIAILKRIADKVWEVNPKAFVILEHFAANLEEQELAAYKNGMLIWGNASGTFADAAMGNNDAGKSNFNQASYQQRGYSKPGLIAYMESHDEERQMYRTENFGNASGTYDTKVLSTAIDRSKLTTVFFLSLAGPKMIWQFGELGYDISIDQGGRVGEKPVLWSYYDDSKRKELFNTYKAMLNLRTQFDVFTSGTETLSLIGPLKKIQLTLNGHNITLIGNFGLTLQTMVPGFQHTGTWYEFFSGKETQVTDLNTNVVLYPGEFQLYSDQKLPSYSDLITSVKTELQSAKVKFFPNPVKDLLQIESTEKIERIDLLSISGQLINTFTPESPTLTLDLSNLRQGPFLAKVKTKGGVEVHKLIKL